jgi:hypothetical protein
MTPDAVQRAVVSAYGYAPYGSTRLLAAVAIRSALCLYPAMSLALVNLQGRRMTGQAGILAERP